MRTASLRPRFSQSRVSGNRYRSTTQRVPTRAEKAALAFVKCVNARDVPALKTLFAPDARVIYPWRTLQGMAEIENFYATVAFPGQPRLELGRVIANEEGTLSMAEVTAHSVPGFTGGTAKALDVFDVDLQGMITNLAIYYVTERALPLK